MSCPGWLSARSIDGRACCLGSVTRWTTGAGAGARGRSRRRSRGGGYLAGPRSWARTRGTRSKARKRERTRAPQAELWAVTAGAWAAEVVAERRRGLRRAAASRTAAGGVSARAGGSPPGPRAPRRVAVPPRPRAGSPDRGSPVFAAGRHRAERARRGGPAVRRIVRRERRCQRRSRWAAPGYRRVKRDRRGRRIRHDWSDRATDWRPAVRAAAGMARRARRPGRRVPPAGRPGTGRRPGPSCDNSRLAPPGAPARIRTGGLSGLAAGTGTTTRAPRRGRPGRRRHGGRRRGRGRRHGHGRGGRSLHGRRRRCRSGGRNDVGHGGHRAVFPRPPARQGRVQHGTEQARRQAESIGRHDRSNRRHRAGRGQHGRPACRVRPVVARDRSWTRDRSCDLDGS